MGCASSKQKRCRHCHTPYSPVPRSYSMHVVHPPQDKDDTYHVVALTSTTLGSLALNSSNNINAALDIVAAIANHADADGDGDGDDDDSRIGFTNHKELKSREDSDFSVGLIEAKSWSTMIQEKIPKIIPRTPVRTPPGEPETINTWELMEGLEEDVEGCLNSPPPHRFRSFSFDITDDPNRISDSPKVVLNNHNRHQIKPIWVESDEEEIENPNSEVTKSLNQLSPDHPFYIKPSSSDEEDNSKYKAIIYSTSLRGVRKTYEDCCHVRVILKGLGLRVDERDVSMHSGFKEELKHLLLGRQEVINSGGGGGGGLGLPRVFVGTKYIGGAEEIKRMHEQGQLDMVFDGCERAEEHGGALAGACEGCGDVRFIPCETCSGSCKIYYEEDEDDDQEENSEFGFQRCPDCNENGLIRCPICC